MDREILDLFRSGDEAAVKAVYERYAGPVFAVSMAVLGNRDLAADATQLTFIKAWRAGSSYDPERDFGPWIYTIARRTAIDFYRRQARSQSTQLTEIATFPPGLERVWEVFEVRSAVDQLPDDEREIVRLGHFEGLTHQEIADRLDIPLGTVKSRSHRAHQRLIVLLRHVEEA